MYAVLTNTLNELFIIQLHDLHVFAYIPDLSYIPHNLPINMKKKVNNNGYYYSSTEKKAKVQYLNGIHEVKLVRIGSTSSLNGSSATSNTNHSSIDINSTLPPLVLILIMKSDDIIVYMANETPSSFSTTGDHQNNSINKKYPIYVLNSFSKLQHGLVTRRKRMTYTTNKINLSSYNEFNNLGSSLTYIDDLDGYPGVLISGARPLLLSINHNLPFLMPLATPELPYINDNGVYKVTSLLCNNICGVICLWRDLNELNKSVRMSSLSFYKEIPNLKLYPNSLISVKPVSIQCTIHKCVEVLCKTDDKIQQALLKKKTFILSCSEDIVTDFKKCPLTDSEKEQDAMIYERFYPDLQSFNEPDNTNNQAPKLITKQYKVLIIQNNQIIDTYILKPDEVIVDIEVVYLNTEYNIIDSNLDNDDEDSNNNIEKEKKRCKKKVFIVLGTNMIDCHGEDTQGEGRLLLLNLDYALYTEGMEEVEEEEMKMESDNLDSTVNNETNIYDITETVISADAMKIENSSLTTINITSNNEINIEIFDNKLGISNEQNRNTSDNNPNSGNNSDNIIDNESVPMDIKLDVTTSNSIDTDNPGGISENKNVQSLPQNTKTLPIPIPMRLQTSIPTQTQQSLQSQAQMEFLGAIQPKLKLLWSGYGPATVVKQFGKINALFSIYIQYYIYNNYTF